MKVSWTEIKSNLAMLNQVRKTNFNKYHKKTERKNSQSSVEAQFVYD